MDRSFQEGGNTYRPEQTECDNADMTESALPHKSERWPLPHAQVSTTMAELMIHFADMVVSRTNTAGEPSILQTY